MVFFEILRQMFRTLWAHKLRSFLTMFGIAWGVGSLLLLVGLGEGFRSGNRREMNSLGEDIMFVFPGRAPAIAGNMSSGHTITSPTTTTTTSCRKRRMFAQAAARSFRVWTFARSATSATPTAKSAAFCPSTTRSAICRSPPDAGSTRTTSRSARLVAVLGDEMLKNLFPGRPAVGNTILLNGIRFQVIGVVQRVGHGDNNSTNNRVFLPFSTMRQFFPLIKEGQDKALSFINYQPRARSEHTLARDEVRQIIARNHGFDWHDEDAFEDWDTIKSAETVAKIFDAMDVFLGGVGLVTLTLGAIGVINIMLVAVSERTREIGLRKALGATNRSILLQFFLEGAFLTLMSGRHRNGGRSIPDVHDARTGPVPGFDPPTMSFMSATLAIGTLAVAGIVAGIYPARKAAMLQPVDALRQE